MTTKQEHDSWQKRRQLNANNIKVGYGTISIHSSDETPLHLTVKALTCLALQESNRAWDCEVTIKDRGRVDVLDLGDVDEPPLAIEIESNPSPKKTREKAKRYCENTPIRDMVVLDLQECPENVLDIYSWIKNNLAGL